jgi:hypothetical protein
VWQLLGSAIDHLRLVGESGRRQSGTNPFAFATLVRTTITATATALWILNEDRDVRRRRLLEVVADDYNAYRTFRNVVAAKVPQQERADFDAEATVLSSRSAWIVAEYNSLAGVVCKNLKEITQKTSDRDMVLSAGAYIDPTPFTDGLGPDGQLLGAWKVLSGYAHGLPWAYKAAKTTSGTVDADGLAETTISGDPEMIINTSAFSLSLIEIAFTKADALCRSSR